MLGALNENIKRLRLQGGYSQVAFANMMNVTKQCVSNWENDNVLPSVEMLVKIADFFHVTTDELLGRSRGETVDVSGLTEEEKSHIRLIVKDLKARG